MKFDYWEKTYKEGQMLNRCPFTNVVTFVYKNYPREKKREEVNILEVGCGAGNNLWFLALEGFNVTGIDISESAIDYAKKRFKGEGLKGGFYVGNLAVDFPFSETNFDLIIDRGALTYLSIEECKKTIKKLTGMTNPEGRLFFNPYSDRHSFCAAGEYNSEGSTVNIKNVHRNTDNITFYGRKDIFTVFNDKWEIESVRQINDEDQTKPGFFINSFWEIIAKKK